MTYKIKYKHKYSPREKEVEADTEEQARKLLKQELIDQYNNYCLKNGITPSIKNFNKNYKI